MERDAEEEEGILLVEVPQKTLGERRDLGSFSRGSGDLSRL
jgi:hypothetical protein